MLCPEGRPTHAAKMRYTFGDCWHLAFETGKILNAPLVAVVRVDDPDDWVHVAVDLGRESLLDVHGVRTREVILHEWEERLLPPLMFRELGRHASLQDLLAGLDDCRLDMMLTRQDEEDCLAVAQALAEAVRSTTV